jgi:hypothetical protein
MDGKKIGLGILAIFIVALFAVAMYTDAVAAYTGPAYMFSPSAEDDETGNVTRIVHFIAKTQADDGTVYLIGGRIKISPVDMDDTNKYYEITGGKLVYKIAGENTTITVLDSVSGSAVVDEYGFVSGEITAVNDDGVVVSITFTGAQFRKPAKMGNGMEGGEAEHASADVGEGMGHQFKGHGAPNFKGKSLKKVRTLGSISVSAVVDGVSTQGYGIFAVGCGC